MRWSRREARREETTRAILGKLSRRQFLAGSAAGVLGVALGAMTGSGCGYYAPERGEAYAPWSFPAGETKPERVAVAAAILAANPHNTQPWRFRVTPERVEVYADFERGLGAMDGLRREMFLGLGCALENLVLAAEACGRRVRLELMPMPSDPTHVATAHLSQDASVKASRLFDAIPKRHTNRGRYLNDAPPKGLEAALRGHLLGDDPVALFVLGSAASKRAFADGTIAATRAILDDTEMNEAGHRWYRHSKEDIARHRDGVTLDATGNGATTRVLGKVTPEVSAADAGVYWLDATETRQTTASAYCILATPERDDRVQQLRCGMAYQRMHLWATLRGLSMQPLNQMAERQDREQVLGLEPRFTAALSELMGGADVGAQMLFRVGYAWDEALSSPRRPLEWVVDEA